MLQALLLLHHRVSASGQEGTASPPGKNENKTQSTATLARTPHDFTLNPPLTRLQELIDNLTKDDKGKRPV